jgi:hypothetical protein
MAGVAAAVVSGLFRVGLARWTAERRLAGDVWAIVPASVGVLVVALGLGFPVGVGLGWATAQNPVVCSLLGGLTALFCVVLVAAEQGLATGARDAVLGALVAGGVVAVALFGATLDRGLGIPEALIGAMVGLSLAAAVLLVEMTRCGPVLVSGGMGAGLYRCVCEEPWSGAVGVLASLVWFVGALLGADLADRALIPFSGDGPVLALLFAGAGLIPVALYEERLLADAHCSLFRVLGAGGRLDAVERLVDGLWPAVSRSMLRAAIVCGCLVSLVVGAGPALGVEGEALRRVALEVAALSLVTVSLPALFGLCQLGRCRHAAAALAVTCLVGPGLELWCLSPTVPGMGRLGAAALAVALAVGLYRRAVRTIVLDLLAAEPVFDAEATSEFAARAGDASTEDSGPLD